MRLLYVVAKAEYFISHRLALAKDAQSKGFKVAVATTQFPQKDTSRIQGIKSFLIRFKRGSVNIFLEFFTIYDLFIAFWKFRPNIVHNVALKPALYGTFISRLFCVPSVNALNGFGYIFTSSQNKARIIRPFLRFALKLILNHKSVKVIVQNNQDYNDCRVLLPKSEISLILGSGVDIDAFYPVHYDGVFTFTLVARMLWSKGIGEFVDAARLFKQRNPSQDVRFWLVGSPDEQNPESIAIEDLRGWRDEGVVEWQEHTEDIQNIYAQSHVAVLPSYREGMPKSLLEAMACGLPIVTSDARGCADIVREGNGIKVPVKNVKALTEAFEKCFSDMDACKIMGKEGRADAQKLYCINAINGQVIKLYETIH